MTPSLADGRSAWRRSQEREGTPERRTGDGAGGGAVERKTAWRQESKPTGTESSDASTSQAKVTKVILAEEEQKGTKGGGKESGKRVSGQRWKGGSRPWSSKGSGKKGKDSKGKKKRSPTPVR